MRLNVVERKKQRKSDESNAFDDKLISCRDKRNQIVRRGLLEPSFCSKSCFLRALALEKREVLA
jgi:hypothetical protein